jgi:uncharacterized protein YpbB
MNCTFTFELYCEEIPAKMQDYALKQFRHIASEILQKNQMLSSFYEEMTKFIDEIESSDCFHLVNKVLHKNNQPQHQKLINLVLLREKWAKIHNVSRQKILKDDDFKTLIWLIIFEG